jgi:hypothetical protein
LLIVEVHVTSVEEQFDVHTIGLEAYSYLYPLISFEMTRRQLTNIESGVIPGRGPMNTFSHVRQFPPAEMRVVVRLNFDTLYSSAFLDLSDGPMVVSAPDVAGRYYLLPMLDMWTDVIASPGWRTSGTGEGHWAITPPGWVGELPDGVQQISAPTPIVWIIGRVQTNGPADYAAVNAIQDGLSIRPLSSWGATEAPEQPPLVVDPTVDMKTEPLHQVNDLSMVEFLTLAAELLMTCSPHVTDWSQLARLEKIGFVAGKPFDPSALSPETLATLQTIPAEGIAHLQAVAKSMAPVVNGWVMNTDTVGVYGNFYAKRAAMTLIGLGANQPEDAIYPLQQVDADGQPATGADNYVLHMDADQLPPVDAFWSVTMYDDEGFQIPNPIDRFALGDRDPLQYNDDGSLDLWVQNESPGPEKEANWLPAPKGPLFLCLRLYGPKAEALDGRWIPAALQKLS